MTEKESKAFNNMMTKITNSDERFMHEFRDYDDNDDWSPVSVVCVPLSTVLNEVAEFLKEIGMKP